MMDDPAETVSTPATPATLATTQTTTSEKATTFATLEKTRLNAFVKWSAKQGIRTEKVSLCNSFDAPGKSIYATESICVGDELIRVPEQILLNKKTLPSEFASLTAHEAIALHLLRPPPSLKPYIDVLPTMADFQNMPLLWKPSDVASLPHSTIDIVQKQQKSFARSFLAASKLVPSLDRSAFLWAWLCVNTRCLWYDVPQAAHSDCMTLAPMVDFLNHSASPECKVLRSKNYYIVVAGKAYDPGEQVFLSYGAHSSEFLLCEYGFTLDCNPWNEVVLDHDIRPLLSIKQREVLAQMGYDGNYGVSSSVSFRVEVALRAIEAHSVHDFSRLEAFAKGEEDDYSQTQSDLLNSILSQVVQDAEQAIAHTSQPSAISIWQGMRDIAAQYVQ